MSLIERAMNKLTGEPDEKEAVMAAEDYQTWHGRYRGPWTHSTDGALQNAAAIYRRVYEEAERHFAEVAEHITPDDTLTDKGKQQATEQLYREKFVLRALSSRNYKIVRAKTCDNCCFHEDRFGFVEANTNRTDDNGCRNCFFWFNEGGYFF